ncbi:hypothetical protein SPAN111604_00910 [Sphingomonas antarctica]|uniref:DUF805 domain-containing protein n=1 Tax=Sphingomonas antarctica TaxID=2040274 RepID=UPI0039E85748
MEKLRLMVRPLRHYADFEGQSSLKEFWLYTLLTLLISIPVSIGDIVARSVTTIHEPVSLLATLLLWYPNWALGVRRLHSRGHSGWWIFTLFGFALIALLSNQMVGGFSWGRHITAIWTSAAGVTAVVVCTIIAFLPALSGGERQCRA